MYRPLHRYRPAHRWTYGDLAAKVGADLGLPPDEEQRWLLDTIYAERAPERPAAFEVAAIAPRQNIKTSTFGVAALADLFVFGVERHLWTAHHGDTLKGTFNDFRAWIKSNAEYDDQVTFYEGHQDMSIVHRETGNRIDFQSRTGKAGRGLTGVKRITLDEALYLEPKHVGAVYPTMLTRPGAQVRIASSAGIEASEQLRRIRDRGRDGRDKRLAYVEYGAQHKPCVRTDCTHVVGSEGCALDDRDLWWQANCALWAGRITEESLADQRGSMPAEEFMREFLSWWEDPAELAARVVDPAAWRRWRHFQQDLPLTPVAFGVTVSGDRRRTFVGVAGRREDGRVQVELAAHGRGVAWAVEWLASRAQRWSPIAVVLDGTAESLEIPLAERGVVALTTTSRERAQATVSFYDALEADRVRHPGEPLLDASVEQAGKREIVAGWVWEGPQVGPLVAVTLAHHGLVVAPERRAEPPPRVERVSDGARAETGDLMRAGF